MFYSFNSFSTMFPAQNSVKGTRIYSAGHSAQYKKNNIEKLVKIKPKEANVRFFL